MLFGIGYIAGYIAGYIVGYIAGYIVGYIVGYIAGFALFFLEAIGYIVLVALSCCCGCCPLFDRGRHGGVGDVLGCGS